jgi:hypothetical protein
MPVSELDLVKAGLKDFKMDDLNISRHAKKRCRERGIPLEDLRKKRGEYGTAIVRGHTVVTAIPNTFEQFSEFIPIKDNGEIVNSSPIVKKHKDTLFKATIICMKEMIPRMIGKHHSYINKLQSYIEGNIYSPKQGKNVFKIVTKKIDDAIFMWKLMDAIMKHSQQMKESHVPQVIDIYYLPTKMSNSRKIKMEIEYNVSMIEKENSLFIISSKKKNVSKVIDKLDLMYQEYRPKV